jgi:V8-like Glu-specific endopeptidase
MIIGSRSQILDGERFAEGLAKAVRAVVRISLSGPGSSLFVATGWLLTPRLVMLPSYALDQSEPDTNERRIRVQAMSKGEPLWTEETVEAPEVVGPQMPESHGRTEGAIALLRLEQPRGEPLPLGFESLQAGDFVSVVQFAAARQGAVSASFGRLLAIEEPYLAYDADTEGGSGGAPVLDAGWTVVAMHVLGGLPSGPEKRRANRGLSRAALVEALQQSRWWAEIAECHKLADVAAARSNLRPATASREPPDTSTTDRTLVAAALVASLDSASLKPAEADRLRSEVVEPGARRWVVRPEVRQAALQSVGSLAKLRKMLPQEEAGQEASRRVVERILAGPPYDLAAEGEESLSWWIQVSRWFQGVAPHLPSPADITRGLERLRVRSRLTAIAGPGFRGRKEQLATLREWFSEEPPVPMLVTGIGGVGKSALVARFASERPPEALLLWLDFDRPDLAPDDAVSVLASLAEQAAVQLEGFAATTPPGASDWPTAASALGEEMARHLDEDSPPLLVLDSFEVAQYTERHEELWPVLEAVAAKVPALRVIVTGRAPVKDLRLLDRPARPLPLEGLSPEDARAWLRENKVKRADVLDRVVELADGIPLILHLAVRLIARGGRVEDLPEKLPPEIVAGFLYDRILDRMQDPDLKPVATGALVLRRLTAEMVVPVLGGLVELPDGQPSNWFGDLAREMALVEGTEVLTLRREVRAAALHLLERDRPALVRAVDERAVQWYAAPERNAAHDVEMAAELVYHRLRLGDVPGAESAWHEGCGALLLYAAEELPEGARVWLQARLGETFGPAPVKVWEQEAAERIRASRKRGLKRAAPKILEEREQRSEDSLLAFHEAFEERAAGLSGAAIERLDRVGYPDGAIGRDRRVLRALLAAEAGDRGTADRHLAPIGFPMFWKDRPQGEFEALGVQAARVRLAVDLEAEAALLSEMQGAPDGPRASLIRDSLSPVDVLLPQLARSLAPRGIEITLPCPIFESSVLVPAVAVLAESRRRDGLPREHPVLAELRRELEEDPASDLASATARFPGLPPGLPLRELDLGWRRWRIAAGSSFLPAACRLAASGVAQGGPLAAAVLGSLAVYCGSFHGLVLFVGDQPLFDFLQRAASGCELRATAATLGQVERLLTTALPDAPPFPRPPWLADQHVALVWRAEMVLSEWKVEPRTRALAFHMLTPDPLEQLVRELAGQVQQP